MANALPATGARPGAEPAPVRALVCGEVRKLDAARSAGSQDRAVATTVTGHGHEDLIVTNPVSLASAGVAGMARRGEVFGRVVETVSIQVVNDQCARTCALAGTPVNAVSAPVTGVWTGADRVVQDHPVSRHRPPFGQRLEWMVAHARPYVLHAPKHIVKVR